MKQIAAFGLLVLAITLCGLTDRFKKSNSPGTTASGDTVMKPNPTEAQKAAIAGGKEAQWVQQGITWTVPQRWKELSADSKTLSWNSGDGAFLTVAISSMDANFPTEVSIQATYRGQQTRAANGEVDELHWMELDGVKGVQFRESNPEKSDDIRRLQWLGYRKYQGQTQLITMILSSSGAGFPKHEDTLYGVLYSAKIEK